jgi:hypothetical protein
MATASGSLDGPAAGNVQGWDADQRQVARKRKSLHQGQANPQTCKRTGSECHAEGADILHRQAAALQQLKNCGSKFNGMALAAAPRIFTDDL